MNKPSDIFSDDPGKTKRSFLSMNSEPEKHDQCLRKEDWGIAKEKLTDHDRRLRIIETKEEKNAEEIRVLDTKTYETYNQIMTEISDLKDNVMDEISRLRKDLGLTKQHNTFQDDKIKGISEAEKQKIERKWIIYGLIIGAILTIIGQIIIRLIEHFSFL